MKAKYKLEKRKKGYIIASIKEKGVRIATQLLAAKLVRKCHADEVSASLIALMEQFAEGVEFNLAEFPSNEFWKNCREAQEKGKTFYYAWFLLSILLVIGELPGDN